MGAHSPWRGDTPEQGLSCGMGVHCWVGGWGSLQSPLAWRGSSAWGSAPDFHCFWVPTLRWLLALGVTAHPPRVALEEGEGLPPLWAAHHHEAELGEPRAPNPLGNSPPPGTALAEGCCWRRAAREGHGAGGSGVPPQPHPRWPWVLSLPAVASPRHYPARAPAPLPAPLPLLTPPEHPAPRGPRGRCHLHGDIPADGVKPPSCCRQGQILHPGALLPPSWRCPGWPHRRGSGAPGSGYPCVTRGCYGAVPLCCQRSIAVGTTAWCSAAALDKVWVPLALGSALHPTAPPACWVPSGCWAPCPLPPPMPILLLPPTLGRTVITADVAGSDAWCLKDFSWGGALSREPECRGQILPQDEPGHP